MLYAFIVTNTKNFVLLAQYYEKVTSEEVAEFNQTLFEKTNEEIALPGEQACMLGDYVCVFTQVNDLRFYVVSREDEILRFFYLSFL
jgi:hypothetical protein